MDYITLFGIAVGLAMDAFAVSIASGVTLKCFRVRYATRVALFFGVFQAVMPVIGWLAGMHVSTFFKAIDHWIAFGLLFFIGGKMIYESTIMEKTEKTCDPRNLLILTGLALATSIDALAVGFSFSLLNVSIWMPVIVIGVVTFVLSFIGVIIGTRFGTLFERKIELVGGVCLIGIGVKILLEHLL